MSEITQLIKLSQSDAAAREKLWTLLINELRQLARIRLHMERSGHTLETDALVNELYLKLCDCDLSINNRSHFMSLAARQLRRLLVDHARAKGSVKRGGNARYMTLRGVSSEDKLTKANILDLHSALKELEDHDHQTASILELYYFGGMSYSDVAAATNTSVPTVTRKMRLGKAWLHAKMDP